MQKIKELYNKTLQRYYNGCEYIEEHTDEADKYMPVVKRLEKQLEEMAKKIPDATEEEILNGFKI